MFWSFWSRESEFPQRQHYTQLRSTSLRAPIPSLIKTFLLPLACSQSDETPSVAVSWLFASHPSSHGLSRELSDYFTGSSVIMVR